MAAICITGTISPRLQAVENILMQAGMQTPRPVLKDEAIDIRQWHRHVVTSIGGESSGAIKDPGRLWELLAGEIVLANLKSPLWGWCDPASIRFLDFWLGFAPEFKFLLVCQTLQQLLAERLMNSDTPLNVAELLEIWKSQHQEMLRFHHRNQERSILIFASDALAFPDLLVGECNKRWKLSLATAGTIAPSPLEPPDALVNFFSYRIASLHPEIDTLNRELIATATIFAATPVEDLTAEPQMEEILADYLTLRQRLVGESIKFRNESERLQNELSAAKADELQKQSEMLVRKHEEQISRLQAEIKEQQQENELLLLQLHQVQEELESVLLKGQESKQKIEPLKEEKQTSLSAKSAELQQENELLLLQLHQVQEELERYFLQYQQIQQQYNVTNSTIHRLLERDPKFYDYEDLEVGAESRGDAIPSVNCRLANLTAAGRHFPTLAFSVAIEQGCAGLIFPDSTVATLLRPPLLTAGESELVISPVGSPEKLQQRLKHLASLSTTDWSLVTTLIRLLNAALAKPKHLQWNSPLDDSSTFLSGLQELERQIAPYNTRLRYDAVRLKREQVNPDYEHLWFEFDNLSFQGEIWPHFEFRLSCAHVRPGSFGGFPKLEFPAEGSQAPFEGWFIEASDDFGDKLELRFSLPDKALDLAVWERVTENDRAFMQALTAELPQFLSTLRQSGVQIARSWEDWSGMAAEMQSVMMQDNAAPVTATAVGLAEEQQKKILSAAGLHYDAVRLKREQVNPDYEHLWFEFGNLAFSGETWPHFEFRLSCAHVCPDSFGRFPKLEFPVEGSQAPFEGWFIEANDDFGDKLELRFSLPDKALDLTVWERVTEHDRAFMKALVVELPLILSTLRQSGVKIRRPWEDWTKMVEEMLPIVTNPAKPKGKKKKSSFTKMLRRLQL